MVSVIPEINLSDYDKELVDIFCIPRGNKFAIDEIISLKKFIPELQKERSLDLLRMLNTDNEYFFETTERYFQNRIKYLIKELGLDLYIEVREHKS